MGVLDLLIHLINFALPALVVGLALPLLSRMTVMGRQAASDWRRQASVNILAGLLVLVVGLVFWGQDGKMSTYMAMVVVCATAQWLMSGAWRR